MVTGYVTRYGEPVVPIQLILRTRPTKCPAVIDTGFNGYLSVPRRLLDHSRWEILGSEKYEIATGAIVEQEIRLGEVVFDGRRSAVYTVITDAQDILIGTKLLRKKILTVNFNTKRITIR